VTRCAKARLACGSKKSGQARTRSISGISVVTDPTRGSARARGARRAVGPHGAEASRRGVVEGAGEEARNRSLTIISDHARRARARPRAQPPVVALPEAAITDSGARGSIKSHEARALAGTGRSVVTNSVETARGAGLARGAVEAGRAEAGAAVADA
jgi:hypothetical protein